MGSRSAALFALSSCLLIVNCFVTLLVFCCRSLAFSLVCMVQNLQIRFSIFFSASEVLWTSA